MQRFKNTDLVTPQIVSSVMRTNTLRMAEWSEPIVGNCLSAGDAVKITHNLGIVPDRIHVESFVDGRWWADEDDRRMWTATTVVFHASAIGRYSVSAGRV